MLRIHNPSGGSWVSAATPFRGATDSTSGKAGLVPGPMAGQEDMVLLGSGTFGLLTGTSIFIFDRYNLCGKGVGEVVTLQEWSNAIAGKLQSRTIINYTDQYDQESQNDQTEDVASMFQKEYVVDTYGYVNGNAGETVTASQLSSAIADTLQARTVWRNTGEDETTPSSGEEDEPTTPVDDTPQDDNEEENTTPEETPEVTEPVAEEEQDNVEEENEGVNDGPTDNVESTSSLKSQMLQMDE